MTPIIRAQFLGPDKSLGLIKGKVYDITLSRDTIVGGSLLIAYIEGHDTVVPYSSMDTFEKYWKIEAFIV